MADKVVAAASRTSICREITLVSAHVKAGRAFDGEVRIPWDRAANHTVAPSILPQSLHPAGTSCGSKTLRHVSRSATRTPLQFCHVYSLCKGSKTSRRVLQLGDVLNKSMNLAMSDLARSTGYCKHAQAMRTRPADAFNSCKCRYGQLEWSKTGYSW